MRTLNNICKMSLRFITNVLTKLLCQHQGSLDFKNLQKILQENYSCLEKVVSDVLSDSSRFVIIEGDEPSGNLIFSPDTLIVAKTSLRVCQSLPDQCEWCENLHLCRYFVCGDCKNGTKCRFSHNLDSLHNSEVLKRVDVMYLEEEELFQLLLQNDPYLLPEVCPHYNKGNGDHGSCRFKAACTNLHICRHFLQDDCKFRAECKRAHAFDAKSTKILSGKSLSSANIDIIYKIYKNKLLITHYKDKTVLKIPEKIMSMVKDRPKKTSTNLISEPDQNEICLYFILRRCHFRGNCARVHHHLPYKWQVLDRDGETWRDFPNGEDIERAYCDPANDKSDSGNQSVDFVSMTCQGLSVRRLSTVSSITRPPNFILTTEWHWYWKNEQGVWTEYGQLGDEKDEATITSRTLENVYTNSTENEIFLSNYKLHFKDMYEQNMRNNVKRTVRRRPRFVSAQEVENKLKRYITTILT
ncbi:protein mono-ADP-ribosyltransferase PARP12-like [Chanos chanos]|uniref:Protein mono-ADP-ribosyltransferase PARP12-like n=1 Tax=Chanos chanos TaxID=29144 RepID=A0A6J2WP93_CHACN|nr:protein mono-ADP-ribosyltransferase PARP12-like [Chanos chanos]